MKYKASSFSGLFTALLMGIVVAVTFVSGCRLLDSSSDSSTGTALTISGRVVKGPSDSLRSSESVSLLADDVAGSTGVAGAEVWVEDLAADPLYRTFTDASGTYLFTNVPPGEHRVVISYLANGIRKKARSEARNIGETSTIVVFDNLVGESVKNVVTGQLRDAEGNFLPAGTPLMLWGEIFTVGEKGTFASPALPESASDAKIFVQFLDGSNPTNFVAPFAPDVAPPFVDLKVGIADNGNYAPDVVVSALVDKKQVSKVNPGTMVALQAVGSDLNSDDQAALSVTWSVTSGTLNNGASDFDKLWVAPDYFTVATITVEIKDPQGATGKVQLPILVGIDDPSQVDSKRPTVVLSADKTNVIDSAAFTVTITFNEPVTGFTIADITVDNATLAEFISDAAKKVFKVSVTPKLAGKVTLSVSENVATDLSNNKNTASTELQVTNNIITIKSSEKAITATTYGTLSPGNVVAVPAFVKVSAFKAGLTFSTNAVVEILASTGGAAVTNQTTTDVTSGMVVRVTAQDLTSVEYIITLGSSAKIITATTCGTLSAGNVVAVPASVKVNVFKACLTVSANATIEIIASTGGAAVANQATTDVTSGMLVKVTAQDLTSTEYTITLVSSAKIITATTYGTLNAGNVVAVPASVKVSAFKAGLTISANAAVEILASAGGAVVTNQATTDVTSGMVIRVTAQDLTSTEYTITLGSAAKIITATTYGTLNAGNVVAVPAFISVHTFKAGLTISANAAVEILASTGGAAVTNQAVTDVISGMVVRVTAQDLTSAEYKITVLVVDSTSANIGVLKYVPAGTFQHDGSTANTSSVSAFRMSPHAITRTQFKAMFANNDPTDTTRSSGVSDPVQQVNWYHALAFCNKLSIAENLTPAYSVKISGSEIDWANLAFANIPTSNSDDWNKATFVQGVSGYRLPTEMEWMWAAMGAPANGRNGGKNTTGYLKAFSGAGLGGEAEAYAWYSRNSLSKTHPAGAKLPNELGLYDMSGNVWEWCWDWYASYPAGPKNDYAGSTGTLRVLRGGSWSDSAGSVTVAFRSDSFPYSRYGNIGFRVVCP